MTLEKVTGGTEQAEPEDEGVSREGRSKNPRREWTRRPQVQKKGTNYTLIVSALSQIRNLEIGKYGILIMKDRSQELWKH